MQFVLFDWRRGGASFPLLRSCLNSLCCFTIYWTSLPTISKQRCILHVNGGGGRGAAAAALQCTDYVSRSMCSLRGTEISARDVRLISQSGERWSAGRIQLGTPASNRKREEWNWNRSVQRRKGARLAMTERKGHYFSARGEKNAESKTWKWKLICGTCSAKAPHCTFKNVHLLTDQLSEFPEMCPTHKAMFRVMFLKRIFSLTQSGVEESFSTFTELQDLLSWRSSGAERQEKWKTIVKTLED